MDDRNYYQVLDIKENATRREIVEAYQKAKAIYSKDSMALYSLYSGDDSSNMLNLIEEAYQVLINPQRRDLYNKEHNISSNRAIVNIYFDKPGEMKRAFVETPNFRKPEDTHDSDHPEINKPAFKAYVSISKQEITSETPEYKANDIMDERIKTETEFNGNFFAEVRKYRNMSLGYVSNRTKIPIYHIEALERDDYKLLPAKVYAAGFVTAYSKLLGFNVEKACKSYMERYDKVRI
ncbi:MAG: helix-turn-helix domain-containing protein [Pseudomonadota bacterium]